jgi:hypothetical protein
VTGSSPDVWTVVKASAVRRLGKLLVACLVLALVGAAVVGASVVAMHL